MPRASINSVNLSQNVPYPVYSGEPKVWSHVTLWTDTPGVLISSDKGNALSGAPLPIDTVLPLFVGPGSNIVAVTDQLGGGRICWTIQILPPVLQAWMLIQNAIKKLFRATTGEYVEGGIAPNDVC